MLNNIQKKQTHCLYRILSVFISISFIFTCVTPPIYAQNTLNLPVPGTMISTSPAFTPAIVTGIKIYPENPLQFDFIIDTGDDNLQGQALREESRKLINYFMATLTVPEDEMWVNLSPYEKDRIIADGLGNTEMGRDMLAQDYMLKQLTASLMYPENEFGSDFWDRVYSKTQEKFGTTNIPTNTFNKIWIIPQEAVVYVNKTSVFVVESHLKVMLEEDYLALETNKNNTKHGLGDIEKDDIEIISGVSADIVKEVLLPEIEKEVNEGKNFANLRQIYNSMLLATWYKKNLKKSLLGKVYVDQNKVNGIDVEDKEIKQKIYNQYVEAFKKGVYDYIKEEYDPNTQGIMPRKYFSGGLEDWEEGSWAEGQPSASWVERQNARNHVVVEERTDVISEDGGDNAMMGEIKKASDKYYEIPIDNMALLGLRVDEQAVLEVNEHYNIPYIFELVGDKLRVFAAEKNFLGFIDYRQREPLKDYWLKQILSQIPDDAPQEFQIAEQKFRKHFGDWKLVKYMELFLSFEDFISNYKGKKSEKGFRITSKKTKLEIELSRGDAGIVFDRLDNNENPTGIYSTDGIFYPRDDIKAIIADYTNIEAETAWQRMKTENQEGWFEFILPIILSLVEADEPITVDSLMQFSGIKDSAKIFAVIDMWSKYLDTGQIEVDGSSIKGYRMGDLMREYIKGKDGDVNEQIDFKEVRANMLKSMTERMRPKEARGGDNAMMGDRNELTPGGIDFNPNAMNIKQQGHAMDINFSIENLRNIQSDSVNGMLPVIINITPVSSFIQLLGLKGEGKQSQQLSYLKE